MQVAQNDKTPKPKRESAEPIVCHHCRAEVPNGSRFCNMCGAHLLRRVPRIVPNNAHVSEISTKTAENAPRNPMKDSASQKAKESPSPASHSQGSGLSNRDVHLKRWLEIIQGRQNIPAFSHHILEVMGMIGNDEASFRHLTNTILHDYSLTLAVLRLANSAYYNRSGKPVCSVARAVTLMGIESIKRVAGGLMLLENYEKRPAGLKELLLLSLLTASHSSQAARHLHMPDSEQAYLCGMFRNLGEILVVLYFPEAYEKILREIQDNKLTVHEACIKVMEFPYEDLGRAVANSWNLPGTVSRAMDPSNPLSSGKQTDDERLKTVVAFSHELTNCVYRRPPEDRTQAIDNLLEKYSSIADLSRKIVEEVLDEAVTETKDIFTVAGVPFNDLHLRRQFQLALSGGEGAQGTGSAALAAVTVGVGPAAAHAAAPQPSCDENLLDQLVAEVKAAVEPVNNPKLNEVLMMALEACHRGAGFDRVFFCLATPDRSMVRGRLGLGPAIDDVIEHLHIPLSGHQESLTLALLTKRDIFIDTQHDDRYQDSQIVRALGACSFGLYPVVVENVVVGCLYFDRLAPNAPPSQKILDTLGQLRDVLAELIRRTRAHT